MFFSAQQPNTSPRGTSKLVPFVESALFVAVGFVLSYIKIDLQSGGSLTLLSMIPILMIGYRRGISLGILSGVVYGVLQMLQRFWTPPTPNFLGFTAVVLLDYLVAFGVLGLSGLYRPKDDSKKDKSYHFLIAIVVCLILRFLCHYLSGIIIWGSGKEGIPAWLWSLTYNGSFMSFELITCLIAGFLLVRSKSLLSYGLTSAK